TRQFALLGNASAVIVKERLSFVYPASSGDLASFNSFARESLRCGMVGTGREFRISDFGLRIGRRWGIFDLRFRLLIEGPTGRARLVVLLAFLIGAFDPV